MPLSFYKPSGKAPLLGILFPLAFGLVAALVVNIAYVWLVQMIPYIILNIAAYLAFVAGIFIALV